MTLIYRSTLAVAIATVLVVAGTALPKPAAASPGVVDQAQQRLREVEDAYSQVEMDARITRFADDGRVESVTSETYKRNGELIQVISTVEQAYDIKRKERIGRQFVFSGDPDIRFFLSESEGEKFKVGAYGRANDFEGVALSRARPVYSPFTLLREPVADFLDRDDVEVEDVEPVEFEGRRATMVRTRWTPPQEELGDPEHDGLVRVELFFDPDSFLFLGFKQYPWASDPDAAWIVNSLTYEDAGESPPRLVSKDSYAEDRSQLGVKRNRSMTEVLDVRFGPIPKRAFTLAAFGIDEPANTAAAAGLVGANAGSPAPAAANGGLSWSSLATALALSCLGIALVAFIIGRLRAA